MNAAERWAFISDVLSRALDLPETERSRFLTEVGRQQPALRTEILALYDDLPAAEEFLETPATAPVAAAGAEPHFGAYRVVGELGEGGMGVVYLAERSDGQFTRRVAVKRLGRAAAGADLLRRFRDERQILARLDHPHIARLLDAGVDAAGVPYLVMEHVEGALLTVHCREASLSVPARLALFLKVCAAVQHAHQNLVVHRDIKPSNILVTDAGDPKLLDFGIAKVVSEARAGDATRTVNRALTLDYASPEQLRGDPVTTSSDVYSLGIVLFELLADARPYEVGDRSLAEALHVVCEKTPPAPSQIAPEERRSAIAGDLDSIVRKSLEKSPANRYGSVAELVDDLERHRQRLPVRAQPDRWTYRIGKFVGRHRSSVLAASLAVLGLLVALGTAVHQARVAGAERERAERRFNDVRKLARSVIFELHDAIRFLPGATPARELLVARALEYVDSLAREAHQDAGLKRELAGAYRRLADVQGDPVGASLGDTKGALSTYRKALALRESIAQAGGDPDDVLELAQIRFQMGAILHFGGDLPAAESAFRTVAADLEALLASGRGRPDLRGSLIAPYHRLYEVLAHEGRPDDAAEAIGKAIEHAEARTREAPDDWKARLNLSVAMSADGNRLAAAGLHEQALSRTRAARVQQEAMLAKEPLHSQYTRALLFTLNQEGGELEALARPREAIEPYQQALALAREASAGDPRNLFGRLAVAVAARSLGAALVAAGNRTEGLERLLEAKRVAEDALRQDPTSAFARNELAAAQRHLEVLRGHAR